MNKEVKCPTCGSKNIIGAGTHEYSIYICKDCKEHFYIECDNEC